MSTKSVTFFYDGEQAAPFTVCFLMSSFIHQKCIDYLLHTSKRRVGQIWSLS